MSTPSPQRFVRQIVLPQVGESGQKLLTRAHVALIGVGGLGVPIAQYLAGAGIGKITLIDADTVCEHNLPRQVLYTESDIGTPKVLVAQGRLQAMHQQAQIAAHQTRLSATNAHNLLQHAHVVIDATDNFTTRFISSATARALEIPWIYGAVNQWEGQAAVFLPTPEAPCYQCLLCTHSPQELDATTTPVGILGPLPGIIGSIQAMESIKCLCGTSSPLHSTLFSINALTYHTHLTPLPKNPECKCNREII